MAVSAAKQARQGKAKQAKQAPTLVDVSEPVNTLAKAPEIALRGTVAAKADLVDVTRAAILGAWNIGPDVAAPNRDQVAQAIVSNLLTVFTGTPKQALDKALDPKIAGFTAGTTPYARLLEARAFRKANDCGFGHYLSGDVVEWTDKDGNTQSGYTFKDRRDAARALVRDYREANHRAAAERDARTVLAVLPQMKDATAEEMDAAAKDAASLRIINEQLERAAKAEAKATPQLKAKAFYDANLDADGRGLDWLAEYAGELVRLVSAKQSDNRKLAALLQGSEEMAARAA